MIDKISSRIIIKKLPYHSYRSKSRILIATTSMKDIKIERCTKTLTPTPPPHVVYNTPTQWDTSSPLWFRPLFHYHRTTKYPYFFKEPHKNTTFNLLPKLIKKPWQLISKRHKFQTKPIINTIYKKGCSLLEANIHCWKINGD